VIARILATSTVLATVGSFAFGQTSLPLETSEIMISAGGNHLSTSLLRTNEAASGQVEGEFGYGDIAWPDPDDPASGRIVFGSMTLGDIDLLETIVAGVRCAPEVVSSEDLVFARLEDVRMLASGRMLAPGGVPERISAKAVEIDFAADSDRSCALPVRLRLEGVTISASDGSLGMIGSLDLSAVVPKDDRDPARLSASLSGVSALTSEDRDIFVLEKLSIDLDLSSGLSGLPEIPEFSSAGFAGFISPASMAEASLSMSMSGLRLPLGAFLPDAERRHLGISADHVLAGDAEIHLEGRGGAIDARSSMDISGFASAAIGARLIVPPVETGGFSFAALAGRSEMAPLLAAEVVSARASFKDDGVAEMILAATGRDLVDHVSSAASRLEALPLGLGAPVADWLRQVATFGGSVTISPDSPVSLSHIAGMAAVAPASLTDILRIETD
jgi:hypothetical protein